MGLYGMDMFYRAGIVCRGNSFRAGDRNVVYEKNTTGKGEEHFSQRGIGHKILCPNGNGHKILCPNVEGTMTKALGNRKKEVELPKKTGNRIGTIIRKGLSLKRSIATINTKIKENTEAIIPFAAIQAEMTGMKSATFRSEDGEVTVKFGEKITYDEADIPKIKAILGPIFDQMFHTIPTFAVNTEDIPEIEQHLGRDFSRLVQKQETVRHTKDFLALIADADSPISKKVRDFVSVQATKPAVSFDTVKG